MTETGDMLRKHCRVFYGLDDKASEDLCAREERTDVRDVRDGNSFLCSIELRPFLGCSPKKYCGILWALLVMRVRDADC